MSIQRELDLHLTRRQLFGLTARGIGVAALGSLLGLNVLPRRSRHRPPETPGPAG